jgi:hypothetical protein
MGRLSTNDKLRLAKLKLNGISREFYFTQLELESDAIEYADFKVVLCRDLRTSK